MLQGWRGVCFLRVWSFNRITDYHEVHSDFFLFLHTIAKWVLARRGRLQNRFLFARVGSPLIFVLLLKIILFSKSKWITETSVREFKQQSTNWLLRSKRFDCIENRRERSFKLLWNWQFIIILHYTIQAKRIFLKMYFFIQLLINRNKLLLKVLNFFASNIEPSGHYRRTVKIENLYIFTVLV